MTLKPSIRTTMRTVATCLVLFTSIASLAGAQPLVRVPFVGAVTDSAATIAAWVRDGAGVNVEYSVDSLFVTSVNVLELFDPRDDRDSMFMIRVTGLAPRTRYYYRAIDRFTSKQTPARSFGTFPRGGIDAPVSFF